jgi:hypothetical protein
MLARDKPKRSSLSGPFVSSEEKSFIALAPSGYLGIYKPSYNHLTLKIMIGGTVPLIPHLKTRISLSS